jgi:hypothetical protein
MSLTSAQLPIHDDCQPGELDLCVGLELVRQPVQAASSEFDRLAAQFGVADEDS